MIKKRTINAGDIIRDIHEGVDDSILMVKYSLTAKGLQSVFQKLLESELITNKELYSRYQLRDDTVIVENIRSTPRSFLTAPLRVHENGNPSRKGEIKDISEKGFQVSGIEVDKDDVKEFVIGSDDVIDLNECAVKAVCRWSRKKSGGNVPIAGFELLEASQETHREISKIKQAYGLD